MTGKPETRPSRRAWPLREGSGPAAQHEHEIPRGWVVLAAGFGLILAGLAIVVTLQLVRDIQQQNYIEGRGQQRDAENERLNQRINDAICDLLDQLPEGDLLDRPREKYGCGPGIAIEDLPADIRQRYYEGRDDEPQNFTSPPPRAEPPPIGSPALPNPYRQGETYRNPTN